MWLPTCLLVPAVANQTIASRVSTAAPSRRLRCEVAPSEALFVKVCANDDGDVFFELFTISLEQGHAGCLVAQNQSFFSTNS